MVAAERASFMVMRKLTHARFMTNGIDMQWALGLKSLPSATGTSANEVKKRTMACDGPLELLTVS